MSSYLTKPDVDATYSDQLNAIRDMYSNKHNYDVHIKTRIIEEQQKKQRYLEFVRRQINGYLTGTCQISADQIIIVINSMIDILKPLDDDDRQTLIGEINEFSLRFDSCLPFIDFSDADSRGLMSDLELLNGLLLSMSIPIELTIDMDTSDDHILAGSLAYV